MKSRREFLQLASITALLIGGKSWNSVAAKQQLSQNDLLKFNDKGQVTLLHLTDLHGQLKPVYFRPPSENFGIGKFEGIPPTLEDPPTPPLTALLICSVVNEIFGLSLLTLPCSS